MSGVHTLLLRLEGPMQSWGYRSRFDYRDTALEPTRSGVIGLICAAMGIARGEDISRFDAIRRMGVRVDREGRPERDYHTALDVVKADGSGTDTVVSYRDYLADASFTVGLESSDLALLKSIEVALSDPQWSLFLGRKAFPLAVPPVDPSNPCKPGTLEDHLLSGESSKRVVLESADGERTQHDWPLCFGERRFKPRRVKTEWTRPPIGEEVE
jgi:CRISPR system Cascade subunit CasD